MGEKLLEKVKRFDKARGNVPGEHWLVFASGVGLWVATRKHPSIVMRVLSSLVGTLLVARAARGRQVPPALARLPFAGRPARRSDWIG